MDYKSIIDNYLKIFKSEYEDFIMNLINEVRQSNFRIDYSVYTSRTAEKPTQITKQFLDSKNIQDHRITNIEGSLNLDLSFYLEMVVFKIRQELEAKLFNEITNKNIELNK